MIAGTRMSQLRRIDFSTDDLPLKNRAELVREFYGRILQRMDYAPRTEQGIHLSAHILPLPGVTFSESLSSDLTVERTPQLVADGQSDVMLTIMPNGGRMISPGFPEVDVAPGDYLLCSLNHRQTMILPGERKYLATLQIPRASLSGLVDTIDDPPARSLPGRMPQLQLLHSYARCLSMETLASEALKRSVAHHLLDLVALSLGATRDAADQARQRGVRAARLAAAKTLIRKMLDAPVITPGDVAKRLGVSPRYLHMLFEDEGVTFAEFVTEQKLSRAYQALQRPRNLGRRIIDIAFDAGFADIRTFNRAFRRRYGVTPSEARGAE